MAKQRIRSATSSELNYGEARAGKSSRDFIHKMKLCLKKLSECLINLKFKRS
ncbi:four helix bundle protein [Flavobacteriaceae bacterium F08102]|nr:four helix bundle protein [Flavobacteriaceae bacterium F08102]